MNKGLRRAVTSFCWLCVALVVATPEKAHAINCRISAFQSNFGIYMPQRTTPLDRTGLLIVRCVGQPGSFSVLMGPGASGDQLNRFMTSGPSNTLDYNIYQNAARTLIWGDGTPPTVTQNGVRSSNGRPSWFFYPYFARIFANQAPDSGIYNDNLVVTVLF